MTSRDRNTIHTLYYFHRYIPASIAKLYGISHQRILQILDERRNETVISEIACQVCSNEDAQTYYIDGNDSNHKPQNTIMLCEPDKRKFEHLQLRRRKGTLIPQMEV